MIRFTSQALNYDTLRRRWQDAEPNFGNNLLMSSTVAHQKITRPNAVAVGTIVWLASELMFFAALFAMYFTIRAVQGPAIWAESTELLNIPLRQSTQQFLFSLLLPASLEYSLLSVSKTTELERYFNLLNGECANGLLPHF